MSLDELEAILRKMAPDATDAEIAATLAASEALGKRLGRLKHGAAVVTSIGACDSPLVPGLLNEMLTAAFLAGTRDPRPWRDDGSVDDSQCMDSGIDLGALPGKRGA